MNFSTATDITAYPQVVAPITSGPSQPTATEQINQTSQTVGGLFVIFLFISYIYVGLRYKKHREERAAARQERVRTLERIWKMPAHQRET